MKLPGNDRIAELLAPYLEGSIAPPLIAQAAAYADLVMRWNARTNLTAVRDPEELLQRQVGESLFAARLVGETGTLLDFGSGAGFPGIPVQMVRPALVVTLAESQGKKAAFLREAGRLLRLPFTVAAGRVEDLPSERKFDVVTMRAVDRTEQMLPIAAARVNAGGRLVRFVSESEAGGLDGWIELERLKVPNTRSFVVALVRR